MIYSRQQCGELRAPSYDAFRYDAMENRWRKSFTVCGEPRSCPIISVQNLRVKSFCSGFPGCQRVSFVTLPENFQVEQDGVSQVRAEIRTRGVVYEHKNGASAGFGILDPRVCVLATAPAAPSKANVPATPTGKSDGTASANPRGTRGAGRGEGTSGTCRT